MNNNTQSSFCFKKNNFLTYWNCQKQSKSLSHIFLLLIFLFLQNSHCTETLPVTWNYHPTLIQSGKYTISSPSISTVPPWAGINYTIPFNRLINPTTNYAPALGFVDLSYLFTYNISSYIATYSYVLSSTSFKMLVYGIDSSMKLVRFSINYLAVSQDLIDIFIWIDVTMNYLNQQINITNSYTTTKSLSQALPTTSNISTIVSINFFYLTILESSSNLFDNQVTVTLINVTHYNWTLSSLSANTFVTQIVFYTIFYQKPSITHPQTLLITYFFNSVTTSTIQQIVYPSDLTDFFGISMDNSFFAISRISAILKADFTIIYSSTFSMSLAFNQTKAIKASIFIFRQLPTCPLYYFLNLDQLLCVCDNINCYEGIGCVSARAIGPNSNCAFCSIIDNFILDINGTCACKTGYQLNNQTCQQVCGDGIKFNDQCDDRNTINGDGCSSQCNIQNGFQCYQNSNGTSICLFKQNICFNLSKIEKNDQNSAIFTFQAIGNILPVSFSVNAFEAGKTLNLTVFRSNSTNCDVSYSINSINRQNIQILVNFQQTLEGYNAIADFNFNNTNYLSQDCTLNFICKGSGIPLIATQYAKQYQLIGKINLVFVFLLSVLFIISMLAPKWIGIESMQVNQLIYFSQLLITDSKNWPVAFQVLKYFKYTNGYNNILIDYSSKSFSNNSKKWNFLYFQPVFILNFFTNFLMILFFFILYFLLRPKNKEDQKVKQQQLALKKKTETSNSQQIVSNQSKKQRKLFQFLINISIWSLLQFLASIISQLELLRNYFNKYDFIVSLQVNSMSMIVSHFIIVFIGYNLFANITLSQQIMKILKHKPQLRTYKKVNFAYHFLIGASMFCFNSFTLKEVPISVLFFIAEIMYIILIYNLKPYKQCVWIHSVGLIFNRFGYLIFLGFITIKNLIISINQIIMLAMCYFAVTFIFILILLSIVRLYYDLRYGEQYEKNMEDIKKAKLLDQKLREKKKQEYQLDEIKQIARKKHSKVYSREIENQNNYRIERIILQEEQIELLQFLQKKNWSKVQKEKYYYQKYSEKPLIWLQKHDKKQYEIRMREKHQKRQSINKKKLNEIDERDIKELEKFKKEKRQELKEKRQRKKARLKKKLI